MKTQGQGSYADYRILTAGPLARVRILYDRAIVHVEAARECLQTRDPEGRARNVSSAFSILTELVAALNHEAAPELSGRLKSLYEYLQWRLVTGHAGRDDRALEEVASLLRSVGEAWTEEQPTAAEPEETPVEAARPKPRALNPYERQGAMGRGSDSTYL